MPSIQTVIVGTTLSEASDGLVRTAVQVANALRAKVHLVHAFELPPLAYGTPYTVMPPIDSEELAAALAARMERQIERLHLDRVCRHVVVEPAHRALIDVAHETAAGLVVVGAADTPLARVLGSTAGRVVRKARCPVLVLRGPLPLPPARVLLPLDLSPLAAEVAAGGFEILAQMGAGTAGPAWRDAVEVEAFHCVAPVGYEGWVPLFDPDEVKRRAVEELGPLCAPRVGAGWKVARRAGFGGARVEILRRIADWHPDLVIMGTHGAAGFERFLVGSVAGDVLERCGTNVLVIPPLAARAAQARIDRAAVAAPPPAAAVAAPQPSAGAA
jgi:nucleotide-binding universal stress UspA family protein